jgi:1-aminocyclopropane-1-carboxylate deaminase
MIAGIIQAAKKHQTVIGINVLKGYEQIEQDILKLLNENSSQAQFEIFNNYHFGGYAKKTDQLITFMNNLYTNHHIPTDIVYSSKLFFAVDDLLSKNYFNNDARLLVIHCGGLQGNLSLPAGTLNF